MELTFWNNIKFILWGEKHKLPKNAAWQYAILPYSEQNILMKFVLFFLPWADKKYYDRLKKFGFVYYDCKR
jgi:hypothetical protein